ncbi:MAG TPA: hypothetical protein VGM84_23010 [Steroidobacteraceae bacterium]|jgi:hypothetical protein
MLRRPFVAWLLVSLAFSGSVSEASTQDAATGSSELPAEERPIEVRCAYPQDGAHDVALGHVSVPKLGELTLRATRSGIDLIVTVVAANGASIGHTETLVRLSPMSPLLVPTNDGFALILIRWIRQ